MPQSPSCCFSVFFFLNEPATTEIYTLSLHDALPISGADDPLVQILLDELAEAGGSAQDLHRSEEHTSELQSRFDLVCRLLLEKKKHKNMPHSAISCSPVLCHSLIWPHSEPPGSAAGS